MGQIAVLLSLFAALATFTDLPERMIEIYDRTVAAAQQIATAGDLRSMSNMLDYHYMRRGRYPREDRFKKWLTVTFKENNLKGLDTDHWGNPYIYRVAERQKSYILTSPGSDGKVGTDDDLTVSGP
ncbi:MAG: type II secretion system protein GspG [Desulfobulbaceae bacterium]|nr:type II secretion system protein GspG [Desulfobulbaceae bacterium]